MSSDRQFIPWEWFKAKQLYRTVCSHSLNIFCHGAYFNGFCFVIRNTHYFMLHGFHTGRKDGMFYLMMASAHFI